ncbi:response regulator transcription factor [Arvimicrobium flavum]|uniref:response regulator transcription factor n=1 Tax=Arvimicrobium flavum TaxID=3393320 RepID=UPI00237C4F99|nr:response regulator [Mesorhizobium shangrilense]
MLTGKLVHVVDDDSGFLKALERLLKAHGLQVRTFASAEKFESEADPSEAACLIVDIQLGGMTGIDLLRRLSDAGIQVPVVLVTANDSETMRRPLPPQAAARISRSRSRRKH